MGAWREQLVRGHRLPALARPCYAMQVVHLCSKQEYDDYVRRAHDRYFPQANSLREHGKYLLYSDGYERASMLGFRCVADRKAVGREPGA